MKRQVLVNLVLILVVALIGWLCFATGKAYNIVFENVPYTLDGTEYPAIEAMQVTLDKQAAPIYLLADDRMVGTGVGTSHTLTIDILDENDKVAESRTMPFTIHGLLVTPVVNVPQAWATGKIDF